MKLLGIPLQRPSFDQFTASAVMACGLWLACVAWMRSYGQSLDAVEAGAALVIVFWGCLCAHVGIRLDRGLRHIAANAVVGAVLWLMYQGVVGLLS